MRQPGPSGKRLHQTPISSPVAPVSVGLSVTLATRNCCRSRTMTGPKLVSLESPFKRNTSCWLWGALLLRAAALEHHELPCVGLHATAQVEDDRSVPLEVGGNVEAIRQGGEVVVEDRVGGRLR